MMEEKNFIKHGNKDTTHLQLWVWIKKKILKNITMLQLANLCVLGCGNNLDVLVSPT